MKSIVTTAMLAVGSKVGDYLFPEHRIFFSIGTTTLAAMLVAKSLSSTKPLKEPVIDEVFDDLDEVFVDVPETIHTADDAIAMCLRAIDKGDVEGVTSALRHADHFRPVWMSGTSGHEPDPFWQKLEGYSLFEWAAIYVNLRESATPDEQSLPQIVAQREILILLHQAYAKCLQLQGKAQPDVILTAASLCLDPLQCKGLKTNGSRGLPLQETFFQIIRAYFPHCPKELFVAETNKELIAQDYNTDQDFYALWCYMTALAIPNSIQEKSLNKILNTCAVSRNLLARICHTTSADHFGVPRLGKDYLSSLSTPLQNSLYKPWFKMNHKKWVEDPDYAIEVISVEGIRTKATTFDMVRSKTSAAYLFSFKHPMNLEEITPFTEGWFTRSLNLLETEGPTDDALYAFGAFIHTLINETRYERGSGAISLIAHQGISLHFTKTAPKAILFLDCYALSMPQEAFIKKIFIPWFRGATEETLRQHLHV